MTHLKPGDIAPAFSFKNKEGKIEKVFKKVKTKEHTSQILESFEM